MIDRTIKTMEDWERLPLAIVTMAGPWLTPLIPAYFVAVAIQNYLNAPTIVAVVAGLVLEVVGIAGIANATRAYMWNRTKRKSDEEAPLRLSVGAVSVYFTTALLLTVVLEIWENLAAIAPGMFIILSISSGLILVLSTMQRHREKQVDVARQQKRQKTATKSGNDTGNAPGKWPQPGQKTRDRAAEILAERSDISGAELGRLLGKSGRTGRLLKSEILPQIEAGSIPHISQNGQMG